MDNQIIEYLAHKFVDNNIDRFVDNNTNNIDPVSFSEYNIDSDAIEDYIIGDYILNISNDILLKAKEIQTRPEIIEIIKQRLKLC